MFARRMRNPYETYRPGDPLYAEVQILSARPSPDAAPYPASERGGDAGQLLEGFNHSEVVIEGRPFHVITGSGGNFVDANHDGKGYGALLAFREKSQGPIGPYRPIVEDGDLKNFTARLGERHGIIWGPGRPDVFPDARGEWWMIAHGVPQHTLAEGLLRGGWPRNDREFKQYYRAMFLLPIKWSLRGGKPWIEVEDPAIPTAP
jgi:hypothetical protein